MTITPLSNASTNFFEIRMFISSVVEPTCLIIDLGLLQNPSSSANIANVKYKHLAVGGISRKASLVTIVFANILLSAVGHHPPFFLHFLFCHSLLLFSLGSITRYLKGISSSAAENESTSLTGALPKSALTLFAKSPLGADGASNLSSGIV